MRINKKTNSTNECNINNDIFDYIKSKEISIDNNNNNINTKFSSNNYSKDYFSNLICLICSNDYDLKDNIPKILSPCAHSICKSCLIKLYDSNYICPFCKIAINKSPSSLNNNTEILSIIKENNVKNTFDDFVRCYYCKGIVVNIHIIINKNSCFNKTQIICKNCANDCLKESNIVNNNIDIKEYNIYLQKHLKSESKFNKYGINKELDSSIFINQELFNNLLYYLIDSYLNEYKIINVNIKKLTSFIMSVDSYTNIIEYLSSKIKLNINKLSINNQYNYDKEQTIVHNNNILHNFDDKTNINLKTKTNFLKNLNSKSSKNKSYKNVNNHAKDINFKNYVKNKILSSLQNIINSLDIVDYIVDFIIKHITTYFNNQELDKILNGLLDITNNKNNNNNNNNNSNFSNDIYKKIYSLNSILNNKDIYFDIIISNKSYKFNNLIAKFEEKMLKYLTKLNLENYIKKFICPDIIFYIKHSI